jgi:uncharacterized protein YlxP (DUF503 family)
MIVGAALVRLHVHGSRSLKEKRGVVRSVTQRLRNRFPLSVAEVGGQDTWQHAVLGLAACGNDSRALRALLERAVEFVAGMGLAEVLDSDVEILTLPHHDGDEDESDEDEEPR